MRTLSLALAVLWTAAAALGETVHMKDGSMHVGAVSRSGKSFTVTTTSGEVKLNEDDVLYVSEEAAPATTSAPAALEAAISPIGTIDPAQVRVQWNVSAATLPEAMLFMLCRQQELLGGVDTGTLAQQIPPWRAMAHDGRRKLGADWITRQRQQQLRQEFNTRFADAKKLVQAAKGGYYGATPTAADQAKKKKADKEASDALLSAVQVWPDQIIRDLIQGDLELRMNLPRLAEQRFGRCIQAEPLVAAFHQGRGLALLALNQGLEALEEFIVVAQLRGDSYASLQLLEQGIKAAPGTKLQDPIYLKAKALLDQYEKPKNPAPTGAAADWLVLAKSWQVRDNSLLAPPVDRIISKCALAVPITENKLLVDAAAVAGAELIYIQAPSGEFIRAELVKGSFSPKGAGKAELPIAVLKAINAKFTPLSIVAPVELKPDQEVMVQSANVYRQMGTDVISMPAKVMATDKDKDKVLFDRSLYPGTTMGVVIAENNFAGFMTGRANAEDDACGASAFLKPADVSAFAAAVAKGGSSGGSSGLSYAAPQLKKDAPVSTVSGQAFLVHILGGEKPELPAKP